MRGAQTLTGETRAGSAGNALLPQKLGRCGWLLHHLEGSSSPCHSRSLDSSRAWESRLGRILREAWLTKGRRHIAV